MGAAVPQLQGRWGDFRLRDGLTADRESRHDHKGTEDSEYTHGTPSFRINETVDLLSVHSVVSSSAGVLRGGVSQAAEAWATDRTSD